MDFDLKQWRNNQHQSDQQHSAKIPRLLLEPPPSGGSGGSALPLFVPESNSKTTYLSAFPDSTTTSTTTTTRFPGMGGCLFNLTQWQELELQALIFKYMLAGAPVPPDLLLHLKKTLLNTPACYLPYPYQQQYQHYQPSMLQSGYWGRTVVDPEPGRCRRTDGKKWRCSRDVVPGQKYCERHVHRGRNRSRKPVEIPTPTTAGGDLKTALPLVANVAHGNHFALSSPSLPIDLTQPSQRSLESKPGNGGLFDIHNDKGSGEGRSDGQLLRHFFDDWPRTNEESNGSPSTTSLSISTPGNPSSDFSLKLATGHGGESESRDGNSRGERVQLNWGAAGWGTHQVSSMGGPLAEALRSSTSNSPSPTSVLHELRRGTASETSSLST